MKILVLANYGMGLFKFRKELLETLVQEGNEVFISLPDDEFVPKLKEIGCKFIDTSLDRRGTNPFKDLKLLFFYIRMLRSIKPDVVLTYTIKPNVYGGIACRFAKIPYIANITGLGTSIENKGLIQRITTYLYKTGLKKASCVFFQNKPNKLFFENNKIFNGNTRLIPGSGVNLEQYKYEEYPTDDGIIRFLFIGRIMKAKGIDELLEAAKVVKATYSNLQFDIVGGMEEDYSEILSNLTKNGIINYHGQQENVHTFIKESHATILPSYHEGTANVLLESAASGRPVLASKVTGCIETFDDNESGFGFEVKNVGSLVDAIIKFIELPYEKKKAMGVAGRNKMEKEFDRNIVINAYKEEIKKLLK